MYFVQLSQDDYVSSSSVSTFAVPPPSVPVELLEEPGMFVTAIFKKIWKELYQTLKLFYHKYCRAILKNVLNF
jgi:hypothetical protein